MGDQLRVTIVQSALHWEMEKENLSKFEDLISHHLDNSLVTTDLIVLPEMFNSGFSMQPQGIAQDIDDNSVSWMRAMAEKYDVAICGSLAIKEEALFKNKFVFADPQGNIETYDKRHCFRMSGEHEVYRGGDKRVIINYRGWRILPQVCYDLRFPVFSRSNGDYDLILYVANWPKVRRNPWITLLQARAIENLSYVVGVNRIGSDGNQLDYSGDSMFVDFKGDIIECLEDKAQLSTQCFSKSTLNQFREKFPAWMDADDFLLKL